MWRVEERSRIQKKLRPRAHREDISNNSTDTGGRALKRLDCAWVVVALDFERHRPAVTDIDDARVFFPRFDENGAQRMDAIFGLFFRGFCGLACRSRVSADAVSTRRHQIC